MQPGGEDVHGAAIGIVAGIQHELVVGRQGGVLRDLEGVIRLEYRLGGVAEAAVADENPIAALLEEFALVAGKPVDDARHAPCVPGPSPGFSADAYACH